MAQPVGELVEELERERSTLERELAEIELLMRQAASEAERHEARRVQADERLAALERDPDAKTDTVREARAQLLSQTRRATLMQAQSEVLEGKQRALQRYHQHLAGALPILAGLGSQAGPAPTATTEAAADTGSGAGDGQLVSREVLAAQEQMRRDIARQMHDGPAQSIANIALQAQVVQRLMDRDPGQAGSELGELVKMVQHALEATKNFIFDVRPMVLDDLGLVPTLRRTASERSRRSGTTVMFESVGSDTRLPGEIESTLFRIIDDAVMGYLETSAADILVRLDWFETGVRAIVRGRPHGQPDAPAEKARRQIAAAQRERSMPAALASMIHEQERSDAATRGLPPATWSEIQQRAAMVGIEVSLSPDGSQLDARVASQA